VAAKYEQRVASGWGGDLKLGEQGNWVTYEVCFLKDFSSDCVAKVFVWLDVAARKSPCRWGSGPSCEKKLAAIAHDGTDGKFAHESERVTVKVTALNPWDS